MQSNYFSSPRLPTLLTSMDAAILWLIILTVLLSAISPKWTGQEDRIVSHPECSQLFTFTSRTKTEAMVLAESDPFWHAFADADQGRRSLGKFGQNAFTRRIVVKKLAELLSYHDQSWLFPAFVSSDFSVSRQTPSFSRRVASLNAKLQKTPSKCRIIDCLQRFQLQVQF